MDVVVEEWETGDVLCGDVGVASPTCDSYLAAAQHPLGAAIRRASSKHGKYDRELADGHRFEAWIVETFGALGPEARARFQRLVGIVQREGEQAGDRYAGARFAQRWLQRLSICLQRGNAVTLIRRSRADHRRASGQRGRPVAFDHV